MLQGSSTGAHCIINTRNAYNLQYKMVLVDAIAFLEPLYNMFMMLHRCTAEKRKRSRAEHVTLDEDLQDRFGTPDLQLKLDLRVIFGHGGHGAVAELLRALIAASACVGISRCFCFDMF